MQLPGVPRTPQPTLGSRISTDHQSPGPCCFPMAPFSSAWAWLGEGKAHCSGHSRLLSPSKTFVGTKVHEGHFRVHSRPPEGWKGGQEPQHHSGHHLCGSSTTLSHDTDTHLQQLQSRQALRARTACPEEALTLGRSWGHSASSTAPMEERGQGWGLREGQGRAPPLLARVLR